jgi:hypothetical protein
MYILLRQLNKLRKQQYNFCNVRNFVSLVKLMAIIQQDKRQVSLLEYEPTYILYMTKSCFLNADVYV